MGDRKEHDTKPLFLQSSAEIPEFETQNILTSGLSESFLSYGKCLRVAAYIRVSTEEEKQEDSYETQRIYFEEFLAKNPGWISAGVYSDYGISGTTSVCRTGYNRLMRHCKEGKIDRIMTKSISRFSRNTREFLKGLAILTENNITIFFEKERLDTAVSQNCLMLTAFGAVAQEESRSISANIQWGIEKRRKRGETRNIPIYGYRYAQGGDSWEITPGGYRFRRIVVCEEEAKIVRRIFQEAAEGKKYTEIARKLNFDRIPAPDTAVSRKRRSMTDTTVGRLHPDLEEGWTPRHISQILRLERYTGDVRMGKSYTPDYKTHKAVRNKGERVQYYVKDHHPAIVSRALFEQVQAVVQINASKMQNRKSKSTRYAFSGRLVCSCCGRFYHTRGRSEFPIWQCASTLHNSGRLVCTAEKITEMQIHCMCRKAVVSRFTPAAVADREETEKQLAQITKGNHYAKAEMSLPFEKYGLVQKVRDILEMVQELDSMECDRSILYRQINDALEEVDREKEILESLRAGYEAGQIRREILQEEIQEEQFCMVRRQITEAEEKLVHSNARLEELQKQLAHMEQYWANLEADYEWRKKTLAWIGTLPEGTEGTRKFLDELTGDYIQALIFYIEVESPL